MPFAEFRYYSDVLGFNTAANLLLPNPKFKPPYPVMFLLHGLSDDHTTWCRATSIERYVSELPLMVVMPTTGRGFYCDATVEEGPRYNEAIGTELVNFVKQYFHTTDNWCAAGLSMGGYGAVRLALDNPTLFTSATSLSGALYYGHYESVDNPEWIRILGEHPRGGVNDLFTKISQMPSASIPKLRIDCGTEDFLLESNRAFRDNLVTLGIEHEYIERPGDHNWAYWDEHIQSAIEFHRGVLGI